MMKTFTGVYFAVAALMAGSPFSLRSLAQTVTGSVKGNSTISGNVALSGNATVTGNGTLSGNATVTGNGTISQNKTVTMADPTGFAINPALRASMAVSLEKWIKAGGVEFHPSLTYVRGRPVLMLITDREEQPSVRDRRQSAMVKACEFALSESVFDRLVISVVETDAPRGKAMAVRNAEVRRDKFHAAVKNASKSDDIPTALTKIRGRMPEVRLVCAELGIR